MDTEDSSGISSMRSNFLSEAGRETSIPDGQSRLSHPLPSMESSDWLLRSGNQVLLFGFFVPCLFASFTNDLMWGFLRFSFQFLISRIDYEYLVQLVIKLRQLSNFLHHLLTHEKWSAQRSIALDRKFAKSQLDQGLLEEDCWSLF